MRAIALLYGPAAYWLPSIASPASDQLACRSLNFDQPLTGLGNQDSGIRCHLASESRPLTPEIGTRTFALDVELALRGQGLGRGARPGERVLAAARLAVEHGVQLIQPRFIRAWVPVVGRHATAVELPAARLDGEAIAQALEGAGRVAVVVCTVGAALDARVSSVLADDPLLALALDGLGSAACERFAEDLFVEIERQAIGDGNQVTGPLSPGMIGWPLLEAQHELFALVDPAPIGVALTSSGQMIPRKTLSFVVGVGADVRALQACPVCGVRDRCKYRPLHA